LSVCGLMRYQEHELSTEQKLFELVTRATDSGSGGVRTGTECLQLLSDSVVRKWEVNVDNLSKNVGRK
jgi:hypothetical protein